MYKNEHALKQLNEWPTNSSSPLVQIAEPADALEKTNA
jgi:hypothetical protein